MQRKMGLTRTIATTIFLLQSVLATHTLAAPECNSDWQQRNYDTIAAIYNTTIYPNNQAFLKEGVAAVPPNLFSPSVNGRISPIGNFSGFEDSVEYFFGLTPPPQAPNYATWTKAKIVAFTSGCPEVASSIVWGDTVGVNKSVTATYGKKITTIKQVAFWRFDDDGSVIAYDAYLPSLALYTQLLYGTPVTTKYKTTVINTLCGQVDKLCTGENVQYNGTAECVKDLSSKDFGSWDEVFGDNVVCRSLHILLAGLRPEVSRSSFV
jgi:hypothetical protein